LSFFRVVSCYFVVSVLSHRGQSTFMIPIDEAVKIIERETSRLPAVFVSISKAVRRVLAEDTVADSDLPPFDRSQMDGYAVKASDTAKTPARLKIVGESAAGTGWHEKLKKGQAVRIMTGAPVPAGADAVQKIEVAKETGEFVEILESAEKGKFIIRRGAEIKKGAVVIPSGEIVTENMVAVLAAFGYSKVRVGGRPTAAILATGSEIVGVGRSPGRDQIRNSNSPMLRGFIEACGAGAVTLPAAGDDVKGLKKQIAKGVERADLLVITGGVSVGKYDFTKTALAELGAEVFFERVRLKPGKPTVFARLNDKLIFGLPGNPVSVAATFFLFVRMALLQMQGATATSLKEGRAVLSAKVKGTKDRDSYLPATLRTDKKGRLIAEPLRWHGSSDFVGFARAEAFIFIPAGGSFAEDDVVKILFLP
jgi:molybdenum cofactor synthesis domain-containing protein